VLDLVKNKSSAFHTLYNAFSTGVTSGDLCFCVFFSKSPKPPPSLRSKSRRFIPLESGALLWGATTNRVLARDEDEPSDGLGHNVEKQITGEECIGNI